MRGLLAIIAAAVATCFARLSARRLRQSSRLTRWAGWWSNLSKALTPSESRAP